MTKMNCLICDSRTQYYFSKKYTEYPYDELMKDVGSVEYHKCSNCGFVISKTHAELDTVQWNKLNEDFHHYMENQKEIKEINQPPYAEQALMLNLLHKNKIIDIDDCLDYAAGYGTLSRILAKYFQIEISIFDPYVQHGDVNRYISEADLGNYKTVINSAMFEHITSREDLDKVNRLVAMDGCLVLHTVVCENIPKNPDWFYLKPPVHTAFHTNRSMEILMKQWGYACSIYCPKSKSWILLKSQASQLPEKVEGINAELQSEWFLFKSGFLDYWKGF